MKTGLNVVLFTPAQKRERALGCRGKYSLSRPHSGTVGASVRSTRSPEALPRNPARRGRLCGGHSCAESGKVIVPHSPCIPCSRGSVVPHSSPEPPPARRGCSPHPCTPRHSPHKEIQRHWDHVHRKALSFAQTGVMSCLDIFPIPVTKQHSS